MGNFILIRPRDDSTARQSSDWCDDLYSRLRNHHKIADVDDMSPPDTKNIINAISTKGDIVFYFGHGDEYNWLTGGIGTVSANDFSNAKGKSIVSIACKTARILGPDAVTAGVECWLGFTIKVPVMSTHRNQDPFGDAIVDGLSCLDSGNNMQKARDDIFSNLNQLVNDFDNGQLKSHPAAELGYFAAMSLRDHVAVLGNSGHRPL